MKISEEEDNIVTVTKRDGTTYKTDELLKYYPGNEKQALWGYDGEIMKPTQYVYKNCCICGITRFSPIDWGYVTGRMVQDDSSSKIHCNNRNCHDTWNKHTIGVLNVVYPKNCEM